MPEYHKAIDISNYSGIPTVEQFQQVKALGYDLVICGTQMIQITEQQWANAIEAGLEVDFYHFLYFDGLDVQRLQYAHQWPKPRMMWVDCEYQTTDAMPVNVINNVLQMLHVLDVPLGIYTAAWWWIPQMGDATFFKDLPLWDADYDGIENFDDFVHFGGWEKPYMKQYAGDQHVAGILCDLNVYLA